MLFYRVNPETPACEVISEIPVEEPAYMQCKFCADRTQYHLGRVSVCRPSFGFDVQFKRLYRKLCLATRTGYAIYCHRQKDR